MCGILFRYSDHEEFPLRRCGLEEVGEVREVREVRGEVDTGESGEGIGLSSAWSTDSLPTSLPASLPLSLPPASASCSLPPSLPPNLIQAILDRGSDYAEYYSNNHIQLVSSVLSLRPPLTRQPFIRDDRFIIQFNGELYNTDIPSHGNDIEYLYKVLIQNDGDVFKTVGSLTGEFAYCITDLASHKVYFGKDDLGRKSLGYQGSSGVDEGGQPLDPHVLLVTSCPPPEHDHFIECLAATVYIFDMRGSSLSSSLTTVSFDDFECLPSSFTVSPDYTVLTIDQETDLVDQLRTRLSTAVCRRVDTIFPVQEASSSLAILFSGGLDCTILAAMVAERLKKGTVDLLNVSFYNPRTKTEPSETPDRILAKKSWRNLQMKYSTDDFRFRLVEIDVSYEEYLEHKQRVIDLIYPNDTAMDLSIAVAFYWAASGGDMGELQRNGSILPPTSVRPVRSVGCKVLLSGLGADELFGGYTRHERIFTPISNQKKRQIAHKPVKDSNEYDLVELFPELRNELQHDLSNLYVRNLSRDDKVISCWSKEVRYPYLDDDFIEFATKVPLNYKVRYEEDSGEIVRKYILRDVARRMGLDWVVGEAKRAIQFGAKSAKMEVGSGKMRGTDKL